MANTVLIVEDERAIVDILKFNLKREGYETLEALDGETGLALARTKDPDLILLDVMLPKMNGFDICATLRKEGAVTPIIMLTAREEEADKVFGLESGADDYITKPFSMRELLARVKANIRRTALTGYSPAPEGRIYTAGDLVLDPATYAVTKCGKPVELTQKEYDLLLYLMKNRGRAVTRDELLENIWGYEYTGDTNVVDVYIRYLRHKIDDRFGIRTIQTIRSVGYIFNYE